MLVSVIIITLNEAENIKLTIERARLATQFPSGRTVPIEIIVSDGGSTDGTVQIANNLVDEVVIGSAGRYKQLNAGAKRSKGDVLLFLHADTLLPKGAIIRILYRLRNSDAVGGSFKKYWNWNPKVKRTSFLKFMSFIWQGFGNWLVRLLKSFPGDNAIFVRKEIFNNLNGFRPLWICEDFDYIRRLKKYGKKKVIYIRAAVLTSTRRFERYGFFRLNYMWFWIYWFWRLGMSQERLKARFSKYSIIPEKGNRLVLRF